MICDLCETNEACVFLEWKISSRKQMLKICSVCAGKLGVMQAAAAAGAKPPVVETVCPVCKTKSSSIRRNGRAGCQRCYSVFKNEIREFLSGRGCSGTFKGTLPCRSPAVFVEKYVLQSKLDEAVKEENYEQAAVYRDYLRIIENTSESGSRE